MAHEHCWSCVKTVCVESSSCPVESCVNGCGASLHGCKMNEHVENICPEAKVKCTNAFYGCSHLLLRKNLNRHIEHCPASILHCSFSYRRETLKKMEESQEDISYSGDLVDERFLAYDQEFYSKSHSSKSATLDVTISKCPYQDTRQPSNLPSREGNKACRIVLAQPMKKAYTTINYDVRNDVYVCVFSCNEIVRRDEFNAHWKSIHTDIQLESNQMVARCPLQIYGCRFGQYNLVPHPKGSRVNFDDDAGTHSLILPYLCLENDLNEEASTPANSYISSIEKKKELALYGYEDDEEESYDVLGQLPIEVMLVIMSYLDSLSLRSLSLVNKYLRMLCRDLVDKKGIVDSIWKKDMLDLPWAHWSSSPKVLNEGPYFSPSL